MGGSTRLGMGSRQALGKLFVKMVTLGAANLSEETNVRLNFGSE